jgi:hypothetical protein
MPVLEDIEDEEKRKRSLKSCLRKLFFKAKSTTG